MQYKSVKGFSGWGQLGMLILFTGLGLVLAGIAQFLIGMMMMPKGTPLTSMSTELLKAMMNPENVEMIRLMQVVSTFLLLGLPAYFFMLVCQGKNFFWLGFNKHLNINQVVLAFFLMFLAGIIASPLADVSKVFFTHFPNINAIALRLENAYNDQVEVISNLKNWKEYILAIFIIALLPALFEELFFRGALQNLLVRWWKMPILAIVVTSLVFSLIHGSIYLFLSRAVLGMVLGLLYYRTKNLWVNVIAHFLNNAFALTALFFSLQNGKKPDINALDPKVPIWGAILAIGIAYGLFLLLEKVSAKNKIQITNDEQILLEKGNPFLHFE